MPSRAHKLLRDIHDAARAIVAFVADRTEAEYNTNLMLRSAVERQFEIVGEAVAPLRREAPDVAAPLSHTEQTIGFRNVIAHGYDVVRSDIVWETATRSLPQFVEEVETQLAKLGE